MELGAQNLGSRPNPSVYQLHDLRQGMESEYVRDDIHKTSVSPSVKWREMGARPPRLFLRDPVSGAPGG